MSWSDIPEKFSVNQPIVTHLHQSELEPTNPPHDLESHSGPLSSPTTNWFSWSLVLKV